MLFKLIPFLLLLRQSVKLYLGAYLFYVDFWNKVMGWLSDTHLLCAGCRLQAASQSNSLTSLRSLKACLTMPNSLRHFSIGFAAPISICLQRPQPEVYCQAVENNRHQSVQSRSRLWARSRLGYYSVTSLLFKTGQV